MSIYSTEQIGQYFKHIGFAQPLQTIPPLDLLSRLQRLQLERVPFESLALHYSTTRSISLDPQDLFKKVVIEGRGGYCLENNTFFKGVLQSLGFQVTSVVCRISNTSRGILDGGWRAMSHMANIITIDTERFLVDVGYGADGPSYPVPLVSGSIIEGLPGQALKLDYKRLLQHTDPAQRVWVYSQRMKSSEWAEIYHFTDVEMFSADFEILNHYNMLRSYFAQHIVVQRFFADETRPQKSLVGSLLLVRDTLRSRTAQREEIIEVVTTEEQRIVLLEKYFRIELNDQQRNAIHGRESELAPTVS